MRVWWDADGLCVRVVPVSQGVVRSVACTLASDGGARSVVTASWRGLVRSWQPGTGELHTVAAFMHVEGRGACMTTYRAPSGHRCVAAGLTDKAVKIWDAETGEAVCSPRREHSDWVRCVMSFVRPDGRVRVVSGSDDRTLRMWSGRNGTATGLVMRGHAYWVCAVTVSTVSTLPNGEQCGSVAMMAEMFACGTRELEQMSA